MKVHELKIVEPYFLSVFNGNKNFEIRKDDRQFEIEDILLLKEWHNNDVDKKFSGFTGRFVFARVSYILRNVPDFGLKDGFCLMGIKVCDFNERKIHIDRP